MIFLGALETKKGYDILALMISLDLSNTNDSLRERISKIKITLFTIDNQIQNLLLSRLFLVELYIIFPPLVSRHSRWLRYKQCSSKM